MTVCLPLCVAVQRPVPTGSPAHSSSDVSAHPSRDAVAGCGLRPRPLRTAAASRVAVVPSLPRRPRPAPHLVSAGADA